MIQTFVFFDLETTGLIQQNFMPKITELSLIAVSRDAVCDSTEGLPRVLHKLVLPIDPNRHIPEKVQALTKLSNENLKGVQCFQSETSNLLMNFLDRLAKPVCFVAYNGNVFDYPILLWELKNTNKVLTDNILSIDMLRLIKDFFLDKENLVGKVNTVQNLPSTSFISEDLNTLLNDGCDKLLSDALDSVMKSDFNNCNTTLTDTRPSSILDTPQTNCYKKMQEINEKTPESQIVKLEAAKTKFQGRTRDTAKRRLNFTSSQPPNFKLTTVCKHIIGTAPENAHSAEEDCLTMLRCATQLGSFFVDWADDKAVPLISHERK